MISVCVASYNGELFIAEQVLSILPQLGATDEIIISDDGSTDRTIEIISDINDKRIKVFHHAGLPGVKENFENALRHARGDLIFLADQDDIWERSKIETIRVHLDHYELVISDCSVVDERGVLLCDSFFRLRKSRNGILRNLLRNSYMGCCMAFRRSLLDKALPFPSKVPMHDWWLGLVAELTGTTFFCEEKLVRYRRHGENTTPLAGESDLGLWQKLTFRKDLVKSLVRLSVFGKPAIEKKKEGWVKTKCL